VRNFLNVLKPLQVKEFDDNEKTVFFQNTQLLFFEKSLFFKGRGENGVGSKTNSCGTPSCVRGEELFECTETTTSKRV
jgi:hypothetical protein